MQTSISDELSALCLDATPHCALCPASCSTTPEEGGETVFPNADKKVSGPEWSDCAKHGLAVKTVRA